MGRKPKITNETPAVEDSVSTKKVAEDTKAAEKKAVAKKSSAKTVEKEASTVKTSLRVQYQGKDLSSEDLINAAKKTWSEGTGKKIADLKSLDLYVKPEESKVYYVANGSELGSFDF